MGKNKKPINPVEKAKRIERKIELKKHKKQRIEARNLNLKNKDPYQILAELERLDQMEFNITIPPPLCEKVISNKRRKLKEIWKSLMILYKREEASKFTELKRLEYDYEAKRIQLIKKYEAVKSTKQVDLEKIPLPLEPENINELNLVSEESLYLMKRKKLTNKIPPGCPWQVPPLLEILETELNIDSTNINLDNKNDLDEFLKEVDQVEKSATINEKFQEMVTKLPLPHLSVPIGINAPISNQQTFPLIPNSINLINQIKKPNFGYKPIFLPLPHINKMIRPQPQNKIIHPINILNKNTLQQIDKKDDKPTSATIEAKPQLRNLSADATRFLPTSLRVKRQENSTYKKLTKISKGNLVINQLSNSKPNLTENQSKKDTAYEEFMKELKDLI